MFLDVLPVRRLHYKECLVELINQNALDPLVLFNGAELRAELCRWKVPVPAQQPSEADQRYEDRLRQVCGLKSCHCKALVVLYFHVPIFKTWVSFQFIKERVVLCSGTASGLKTTAPPTPSPSSPPAAGAPWYSVLSRTVSEDSQHLLLLTD